MSETVLVDLEQLKSFWRRLWLLFRRVGSHTPLDKLHVRHIESHVRKLQSARGKPKRVVSRDHYWRAQLYRVLAAAIGLCSVYLVLTGASFLPPDFIVVMLTLLAALLVVGLGLFGILIAVDVGFRARALLYPHADDILKHDPRPPIVLLRSFGDDQLEFVEEQREHGWLQLLKGSDPRIYAFIKRIDFYWNVLRGRYDERDFERPGVRIKREPFESVIHRQLRKFGPLIAIGRPGERAPKLEASRAYLSDEEWRETVLAWLDRAQMIVLIAGYTDGVTWELEQIAAKGHLGKVLVLLPPVRKRLTIRGWFMRLLNYLHLRDEEHRRRRWRRICDKVAPAIGRDALRRQSVDKIIALHFTGNDHQPVVIRGSQFEPKNYSLAMRVVIYSMFCQGRNQVSLSQGPISESPPEARQNIREQPLGDPAATLRAHS